MSRSCWNCHHQFICKGFDAIAKAVDSFGHISINRDDTPGNKPDIYVAVAKACTQFAPSDG